MRIIGRCQDRGGVPGRVGVTERGEGRGSMEPREGLASGSKANLGREVEGVSMGQRDRKPQFPRDRL